MRYKTYNSEAHYITKVVMQASKIIKHGIKNKMVMDKGSDDLVTNLDLDVEKYILEKMNQKFVGYSVVSEDFNPDGKLSDNCFTIDPIDGTINFANGLGHWCIQVALIRGGKNIVSVMYFPVEKELYTATLGGGAYLNGKPIHVNSNEPSKVLYNFVVSKSATFEATELLKDITKNVSRHERVMGSQSSAFAQVACGRLGGFIFGAYSRWDIEPGRLLIEEAGAVIKEQVGKYVVAGNTEKTATAFNEYVKNYYAEKPETKTIPKKSVAKSKANNLTKTQKMHKKTQK